MLIPCSFSEKADNAVLLCRALSGDSHVAAHNETDDSDWWKITAGTGKRRQQRTRWGGDGTAAVHSFILS
ncbi:MAG: hypothetical protein LBT46_00470 [Planctomycetaceae bacterium]|nr:hypothetical protein [Planctomycetaceae bacterium]